MRCPHCRGSRSSVIDSRRKDSGIRRRRKCLTCNERFTTAEVNVFKSRSQVKKVLVMEERRRILGLAKGAVKEAVEVAVNLALEGITEDT